MRVLVVEDEPDLRRLLEQALREEGYAVDVAGDGKTGLYKATEWDYDAVVLDLMLPGMNGWDVLSRLRTAAKPVPVLILTARDGLADRVRGLDSGADDYLVKPFALAELHARLRALIRRSAGQASPRIEIDGVVIDTAARTVLQRNTHGDNEPVHLTAREYSLVEMLALRRGQVVTRTDLYAHLFDEEEDSFSNLLDVHVSNIRKKLGKDFIQTRRGYGYVVE
jgi:two-component system OmpR family response regulator